MHAQEALARPIGVFDSGVGGLTVLRALLEQMPDEDFVYLGDTARLPYGTRSPGTVERYALQAAGALIARGVKALIVACNTASAVGLPALRSRHPELPVIGVVEPGAAAAVAASRTGQIAVIATQATVRGDAYARAITALRPAARVHALACQLFVALAEEGWTEGEVARAVAQRYLSPLFGTGADGGAAAAGGSVADTLVLGCTHFPLLQPVIRTVVGPDIAIVDSAATTAHAARAQLGARGLLRGAGSATPRARPLQLLATDGTAQFARVGGRFLGRAIAAGDVELVDL
jgi:glutamate racemase